MYLLPVALLKGWAACSHGPEGANPGCTSQITMERKQYAKETWQPLRVELLGTAETMALYRTPPNFRGEVGGGGGGSERGCWLSLVPFQFAWPREVVGDRSESRGISSPKSKMAPKRTSSCLKYTLDIFL